MDEDSGVFKLVSIGTEEFAAETAKPLGNISVASLNFDMGSAAVGLAAAAGTSEVTAKGTAAVTAEATAEVTAAVAAEVAV